MKINLMKKQRFLFLFFMTVVLSITSCQPDDSIVNNGLTDNNVDASFQIVPVEGKVNIYKLIANTTGVTSSLWDTGAGFYAGKMVEEISLPDAGTYTIFHTAIGKGGGKTTASKDVVVATSDPLKGNLVKGGSFATAEDQANWKIVVYGAGGNWTYSDKGATVSGGHAAIYQAIDVVKDKEYTIDMSVTGGASTDMWFEVYAGKADPATTSGDYSDGGKVMGLNTWDGCGKTAVSGKLSSIGCTKNAKLGEKSNVVKFDTTGKIYLMVRCGGGIAPGGLTIKGVELRGK